MDSKKRAITETLGALTVVLSLLFLGLQIRQANIIAGREARTEMDFQFFELNKVILENPSVALLRSKLRNKNAELTEVEIEQAFSLGSMYASYWAAMNSVVASGMVSDQVLEIYSSEVRLIFNSYPGVCPYVFSSIPESVNSTDFKFFNVVLEEIERLDCKSKSAD